jgi:PAS domain S-box-containing protein
LYLRTQDNRSIFTLGARLAFAYLDQQGIHRQPLNPDQTQFRLGRAVFMPLAPNDGGYVGVDAGGYQILSNFPHFQQGFRTISLTAILQGQLPRDLVRDRLVFIGLTAESINDKFFTSYTTDALEATAGVEVHALLASQLLSAALDERPLLSTYPEPMEWLWVVVWSTIGAVVGWTTTSPRQTAAKAVLLGMALCGGAYGFFLIGWWVMLLPPLLALTGSAITSSSYRLWENLKEYARTLEQKVEERTLKLQQEIVERQQAELALVESEARFRQLAGAAVEAIAIIEQSSIVDVNEALTCMFGYAAEDVIGLPVSQLVTSDYQTLVVQHLQAHDEAFYEVVCLRQNGTIFPAEIRTKVATYSERVVQIASIYDLTDRKCAEEASLLDERNRMAREIHDILAQAFTGILLHIGAAMEMMVKKPAKAEAHLETVDELARTGLAEARRSVVALRPKLLEEGNLSSALKRLTTQMQVSSQTQLTCEIMGVAYALAPHVENHLLRIGQEALTNAVKYAHATNIHLELVYEATQCLLRVQDDGQGFDVAQVSLEQGFGLVGMSERAEQMNSELIIQSQPGQGTEIVVIVNREQSP